MGYLESITCDTSVIAVSERFSQSVVGVTSDATTLHAEDTVLVLC